MSTETFEQESAEQLAPRPALVRGNFDFIDLALPRIIVIRQGQQTFSFKVRPIPESRWLKYFDGIVSTAERDGQQVKQHVDASAAGLELVDDVLIEADSSRLAHRLAVANVLTSAFAVENSAPEGGATSEAIRLNAVWSAGEAGTMRRYKNLVHWFGMPTAEQYRRFRRDDSRSQIVGGSRKGMTIYHGAQRTLAALYDELVVAVAGYALNGVALEGRDQIARCMDAFHKVAAMVQLFAPASVEIEDEVEDE